MFSLSTIQSEGHKKILFFQEIVKAISPSIQTLIEEIKSVVFEKDEWEYRDISILKALLPLVVNQDSKFDAKGNLLDFEKQSICLKYKTIDWHLDGKRKQVQLKKKKWVRKISISRQTALSGNSGPPGVHYKEENQNFRKEYSNTSAKIWIEVFEEEIKSVVLEKTSMKMEMSPKKQNFLAFLEYHNSHAGTGLVIS